MKLEINSFPLVIHGHMLHTWAKSENSVAKKRQVKHVGSGLYCKTWSVKLVSHNMLAIQYVSCRGAVASWLVHLPLDRVVRVRTLASEIVLCSCTRHFAFLSNHEDFF